MARTKQVAKMRGAAQPYDWDLFWSRLATKTLPVEILEAIVHHVNCLRELHALLTVNKTMFAIASKALYRDPSNLASFTFSEKTYNQLFNFILAHSQAEDEDTQLFRELRGVQRIEGGEAYADYLSSMRTFHLSQHEYMVQSVLYSDPSFELLKERRQLNYPEAMSWMGTMVTWAAVYGRFGNIQRLSIFADHIHKFVEAIPFLTTLNSVYFDLDSRFLANRIDQLSYYQAGLAFVEAFVQHHGLHQLKIASFEHAEPWYVHQQQCIETEARIQLLLGPPTNVTSISNTNWSILLSFADLLDLTSVKSWNLPDCEPYTWQCFHKRWPALPPQTLFQRCRSLEELHTSFYNADTLKWAVVERRTHATMGEPQHLIPLKVARFSCAEDTIETITNDLIQGFGETLEECCISTLAGGTSASSKMIIGAEWPTCPRLWLLTMSTISPIVMHPGAFEATPNLEQLIILDHGVGLTEPPGDDDEGEDYRQQPVWDLPRLKSLRLTGYVTDTFDPRSFTCMQALEYLALHGARSNGNYIFPRPGSIGDLHGRLWTWDIALPQLRHLSLYSHHAHRFRFRFLRLCPSLESLLLDTEGHGVLLSDDLGCVEDAVEEDGNGTQNLDSQEGDLSPLQREVAFSCLSLRSLSLNGAFVLSDKALTLLLTRLCPKLTDLILTRCKKYTTEALVELCEAHPYLNNVTTSRQITKKQMRAMRLERPRPIPKRYREYQSTDIYKWFQRYMKGDDSLRQGPVFWGDQVINMLEPYVIYQMGIYQPYFRRARDI